MLVLMLLKLYWTFSVYLRWYLNHNKYNLLLKQLLKMLTSAKAINIFPIVLVNFYIFAFIYAKPIRHFLRKAIKTFDSISNIQAYIFFKAFRSHFQASYIGKRGNTKQTWATLNPALTYNFTPYPTKFYKFLCYPTSKL